MGKPKTMTLQIGKEKPIAIHSVSAREPRPLVNVREMKSHPIKIPKLRMRQIIGKGQIGSLFSVKFYVSPPWMTEMFRFSNRWHRARRWQVSIGFKLLAVARGEPLTITEMLEKDFGARS